MWKAKASLASKMDKVNNFCIVSDNDKLLTSMRGLVLGVWGISKPGTRHWPKRKSTNGNGKAGWGYLALVLGWFQKMRQLLPVLNMSPNNITYLIIKEFNVNSHHIFYMITQLYNYNEK